MLIDGSRGFFNVIRRLAPVEQGPHHGPHRASKAQRLLLIPPDKTRHEVKRSIVVVKPEAGDETGDVIFSIKIIHFPAKYRARGVPHKRLNAWGDRHAVTPDRTASASSDDRTMA